MQTDKFSKGMDFAQFLYTNYGFSVTEEQRKQARINYTKQYTNNL